MNSVQLPSEDVFCELQPFQMIGYVGLLFFVPFFLPSEYLDALPYRRESCIIKRNVLLENLISFSL